MSGYNIKHHFQVDGIDWELMERKGRIELWFRRDQEQYQVLLYEHVRQDEEPLMVKVACSREEANDVFDKIARVAQPF